MTPDQITALLKKLQARIAAGVRLDVPSRHIAESCMEEVASALLAVAEQVQRERYCPQHQADTRPAGAMSCPMCLSNQAKMFAQAADTEKAEAKHWREKAEQVRAEQREQDAQIAERWAQSPSCSHHDDNPCCHVRTGLGITAAIRSAGFRAAGAGEIKTP